MKSTCSCIQSRINFHDLQLLKPSSTLRSITNSRMPIKPARHAARQRLPEEYEIHRLKTMKMKSRVEIHGEAQANKPAVTPNPRQRMRRANNQTRGVPDTALNSTASTAEAAMQEISLATPRSPSPMVVFVEHPSQQRFF